ncbi:MAG TPA: peptidylprolyl isomerase [Anaeromyxobacteraceae bacterium]|nr:peptidylprolyl isomerase [Anaeromyxobacteraceae bacterium]
MQIGKGSVVELDYRLHLGDGKVIDQSQPGDPLSYIHGEGHIVPGLENALSGLGVGDSKQVVVAPAEGYGDHDARGVQEVPRNAFPPDFAPEVGMEAQAQGPDGEQLNFVITDVKLETVTIDMNHPLAGKTLHFDVTVKGVRAATPDELQHGHVHGAGGHEH